jgi:hypothetical protein
LSHASSSSLPAGAAGLRDDGTLGVGLAAPRGFVVSGVVLLTAQAAIGGTG